MYTEFFGLEKRPFVLSPDPEFLYRGRVHDLACKNLEYCLQHHANIGMLTGEVGTGKTTLLRHLYDNLKASRDIALIPGSRLAPQDLLGMLVKAFELSPPAGSKTALVDALFEYFLRLNSGGKQCVIIIDEAENLPVKTFEELRVLSSLEVGCDNLVQIILAGLPQLRERLGNPSLAPLAQRITIHHHLSPLPPNEVGKYVTHRLSVAGFERKEPLFTETAMARVADLSKGVPGIINSLCEGLLISAFKDGFSQVSEGIVEKTFRNKGLMMGFQPVDSNTISEGALANYEFTEPTLAELSPEVSVFEEEGADTVDFAFAPVPSHYTSSFSQLAERLKALEMRLNLLELQCRDNAIAVLQETFEKQRKRTSQHAKLINSLNSSNSEICSQLKELRNRLNPGETKLRAVERNKMPNADDATDTAESAASIWSLCSRRERRSLSTLALLLIGIGALGFLLYQGDWRSWMASYRSGLQFIASQVMQDYAKRSELSPEASSPQVANAREDLRSLPPGNTNQVDAGMRRPIVKPLADFGSPEPKQSTEATSQLVAPPDDMTANDERLNPPGELTELNPGMEKPIIEQEVQNGPQKDPPTTIPAERPLAETRSVLLFQLGRELRSGAVTAPQVSEMPAVETQKEGESPQTAFPKSDVFQPVSTARFSAEPPTGSENPPSSQGGPHRFEIEAVQACWVQATIDKNKTERVILEPGTKRAWEVAQEVEVVLGNPGGVQLKWDRKPINQVGKPGQPMRFRLPNAGVAGKAS
jgi:general secretion pathway protein A